VPDALMRDLLSRAGRPAQGTPAPGS
jgi:hypothetical protein